MKKIILFNTSCGSQNMGDYIICESVERELNKILKNNFIVNYATHTPIIHFYQAFNKNPIMNFCNIADFKFLEGTNILQFNMIRPWANLNTNLFNLKPLKNTILVGAGINPNSKKMNLYTRILYKKILNKEYIHSTRDENTKRVLESLGLKAINTGCATMWMLTPEFCKEITTKKGENVIFTLTDYCKDKEKDQKLIDILNKNYKKVYFWIQGSEDLEYLNELKNIDKVNLVGPNLNEYRKILKNGNIDYIGTRLHAGIFAMQNKCRSIILVVDNRARDISANYNVNNIERSDIDKLDKIINNDIITDIKLDEEAIKRWKEQFKI